MSQPTTFSQCARIIQYGMRNAYILEEGQEPNSEQLAEGMNRLNDLCNFLQTKGLKLWTMQDLTVPLVVGQGGAGNPYTLTGVSGKPLRIPKDQSYVLISVGTVKRPVISLSWQEWTLLSPGAINGPISQIFVDKQRASLNVYTYLIPDATEAANALHVVVQQQMTQYQNITDATQFPQEWFIGLQWLFSREVCTGKPANIITRCTQMAEYYLDVLEGWDVEDTETYFTPDTRGLPYVGGGGASFL